MCTRCLGCRGLNVFRTCSMQCRSASETHACSTPWQLLTPTIDFSNLASQAAAGPDTLAYLKATGIDRTATLALITTSEDAIADTFVNGQTLYHHPQGQDGHHGLGHPLFLGGCHELTFVQAKRRLAARRCASGFICLSGVNAHGGGVQTPLRPPAACRGGTNGVCPRAWR